eukprot:6431706-Alexandrium_andersonii.AAC.1
MREIDAEISENMHQGDWYAYSEAEQMNSKPESSNEAMMNESGRGQFEAVYSESEGVVNPHS